MSERVMTMTEMEEEFKKKIEPMDIVYSAAISGCFIIGFKENEMFSLNWGKWEKATIKDIEYFHNFAGLGNLHKVK